MGFNCGVVGLPNVGKSTIFNALTKGKAQSANYPFCTIDPNVGIVPVNDMRLKKIQEMAPAEKVVLTTAEIVDIAGLVKGASTGEGLGNQFLSAIQEVDAILEVVRVFEDENVIHVTGSVDPVRDTDIIRTELMLKDIDILSKAADRLSKKARGQDKDARNKIEMTERFLKFLNDGKTIRQVEASSDERDFLKSLHLLTEKPVLYVANVTEEELAGKETDAIRKLKEVAQTENSQCLLISGKIEEELSQLEEAEREEYLKSMGLKESGLDRLVRAGYDLLNLITFFTVGGKENRAWTIAKGFRAPQAAGKIHSDFERGFIRAEVIGYDDFVACGGEAQARTQGKLRTEGKEYMVSDGDIMHFRFNV